MKGTTTMTTTIATKRKKTLPPRPPCRKSDPLPAGGEGSTTRASGSWRQQLRCAGATSVEVVEVVSAGLPRRRRGEEELEEAEEEAVSEHRRRGSLARPRPLPPRAANSSYKTTKPACLYLRSCRRSAPTRSCSLRCGPGPSKGTGRGRSCSASSLAARGGKMSRGREARILLLLLLLVRRRLQNPSRPRTRSRALASSRRWKG